MTRNSACSRVATTEIFNVVAIDQLRAMLGPQVEIKTQLAGEAQLEDYIDQFYGYELSVDGILKEIETGEIDYEQPADAAAATNTRSRWCGWSTRCWSTR